MPARRTPPKTIALITALAVLPPALIFYADAQLDAPAPALDAGTTTSSSTSARDGSLDLDDDPYAADASDEPVWDDEFLAFQTELGERCNASLGGATTAEVAAAQEKARACVAKELSATMGKATAALPPERQKALSGLAAELDAGLERLCLFGDERWWSDHVHGLRYDGEERVIDYYLPCLRRSRLGMLFLYRALGAGERESLSRHLDVASPIGQSSKDAIVDVTMRAAQRWDRGLPTGYLRYRAGKGAEGVLGPRAWANLESLAGQIDGTATRFGEAMCQAFPAIADDRGDDCKDAMALYFYSMVDIDAPKPEHAPEGAEADVLGPSLASRTVEPLGYLPEPLRRSLRWTPKPGEPLELSTLAPVVELLKSSVNEAFQASLGAQPARAATLIREQARWSRHVTTLCSLDEELFWRGPQIRYHGRAEGVVNALCLARAHALRLVELGAGKVPFAMAVEDMDSDARAVLDRLSARPLPVPALRAPRAVDSTHGTPLTPADDRALAEARASVLASAAALAASTCAAWAQEDRAPLPDCAARLRGYYLAYGAFSSVALERAD